MLGKEYIYFFLNMFIFYIFLSFCLYFFALWVTFWFTGTTNLSICNNWSVEISFISLLSHLLLYLNLNMNLSHETRVQDDMLFLASFCLGRQWNICHGLVCGWVVAPAVTVQPIPGVTSSVAVTAVVVCAWLHGCWCFPLLSVPSPHFPLILSLLLTHLNACLDNWPPTAAVCSYSFPACWIDVACLQISFTDVFEVKNRPSCRSRASCKLSIQYVLGDSSILHVADVTKPVQVPLGKQSKHTW